MTDAKSGREPATRATDYSIEELASVVREVAARRNADIGRAYEDPTPGGVGGWIPARDPVQAGGDISRLLWVLGKLGMPGD